MSCSVDGCERNVWKSGKCYRHMPAPLHKLRFLPAEPLVTLVEARGGPGECGAERELRRAYHRAKTTGRITDTMADRLTHALLGCHPCEVWGDWFGPYGVSV